jgi:hypothetical protein
MALSVVPLHARAVIDWPRIPDVDVQCEQVQLKQSAIEVEHKLSENDYK